MQYFVRDTFCLHTLYDVYKPYHILNLKKKISFFFFKSVHFGYETKVAFLTDIVAKTTLI